MKQPLMQHQCAALAAAGKHRVFAHFCEQGTGKTVILLAEAEYHYQRGSIDAMFVLAPNGVHTNWTRREIPAHLEVEHTAVAYRSGRKTELRAAEALMKGGRGLRILTMNIEAINTQSGYDLAMRFVAGHKTFMVIDESSRIKNPNSKRTKRAIRIGRHALARRIASGAPLTHSPPDLFAQFEFLQPRLLGTDSYRAFVAEYSQLLPPGNPLVTHANASARRGRGNAQIVRRDRAGRPMWRNLDKLRNIIKPHMFRALKKDCLDLPEKIYTTRFFELSPAQRSRYERLATELTVELEGELFSFEQLAAINKLQQVTSGFVIVAEEPRDLPEDNPRMAALMDVVDDIEGSFIVWAKFREELKHITAALRARKIITVQYHGGVSAGAREEAVDDFQSGVARAFVGQPRAGGIGLTLTRGETVVYYSNDFDFEARTQSEDRSHRHGTRNNVLYIDIAATDTIDERISAVLQRKGEVAARVLDGAP